MKTKHVMLGCVSFVALSACTDKKKKQQFMKAQQLKKTQL